MSAAATKPAYTPRILKPVCKITPHGITAYLVESHRANEFYFVWIQPGGNIRCQCQAAKFGHDCCHKAALKAKLEAERLASLPRELSGATTSESDKLETIAARAERALPADHVPETFSIFAEMPRERRYQTLEDERALADGAPRGDYYSHAYR